MGNTASNIVDKVCLMLDRDVQKYRIICCGLDFAGKTSLMYALNGSTIQNIPTIGITIDETMYKNMQIMTWDVGGRCNFRPLFRHYYSETAGIIFVIDMATDDSWYKDRSKDELTRLLSEPDLIGIPLLILGNKADLPTAMSQLDFEEFVDLSTIQKSRAATVRRISVISHKLDPEPIRSSLGWLGKQIGHKALCN